mmetsp:Transcript_6596/g.5923  ORF Transcript_6596/g.5923 Transcript_6596/m.5923 type:complete len:128 (+) Transcript_6596:394-777(+)
MKKSLVFDSSNPTDCLIEVFKEFIRLDKDVEASKRDLHLVPDFCLRDLFRTFDVNNMGIISTVELKDGMKKFGVSPNSEELYLFMRKFDRRNDGKFRYADFEEAFAPKDKKMNDYAKTSQPRMCTAS